MANFGTTLDRIHKATRPINIKITNGEAQYIDFIQAKKDIYFDMLLELTLHVSDEVLEKATNIALEKFEFVQSEVKTTNATNSEKR